MLVITQRLHAFQGKGFMSQCQQTKAAFILAVNIKPAIGMDIFIFNMSCPLFDFF